MVTINEIIRTRRRTIALIVERDGSLIVRAPMRTKEEKIHDFVRTNEKWILKKQAEFRAYQSFAPKEYVNGEEFWFLGQIYKLQIVDEKKPTLYLNGSFRLAKLDLSKAEVAFEKWYRKQAYQVLNGRVQWYAAKHGYQYKQVKITSARTRWGSCSSLGTLSFTWRLVMAPMSVIDYVVIHELIHLKVKNHSAKFWREVAMIMPDYKEKLEWLRKNGHLLNLRSVSSDGK
jgi:predicted metal-dependent hydrolase